MVRVMWDASEGVADTDTHTESGSNLGFHMGSIVEADDGQVDSPSVSPRPTEVVYWDTQLPWESEVRCLV